MTRETSLKTFLDKAGFIDDSWLETKIYSRRMPSQLHEALLQLFRNRPSLAPELLRDALQLELPFYSEVRLDSADFADLQPAEYRADMVILLLDGKPVLGIIVEVQLSRDERKGFVWPAYVANLRARLRCPVYLLVVTCDESVARWAARPVEVGNGWRFAPWVIGPAGVPEVLDVAQARSDPELAVLSAIAHGTDADIGKSIQIAFAAQAASAGLDEDRSKLYVDLIMASLSEAARRGLQTMDLSKYEYQSDFAKQYVAQGRALGEARGRAALVIRLLTVRFGTLAEAVQSQIMQSSIAELDEIGERLLNATTVQEALGSP